MKPFIVQIAIAPKNIEKYKLIGEEEQSKLINPIDSEIVAIGVRVDFKNNLFIQGGEKDILQSFWELYRTYKLTHSITGFNIKHFDIPFIVTRCFVQNVAVEPFSLKELQDIKEHIHAFRYGQNRGKLSEFGTLFGIEVGDFDGHDIIESVEKKDLSKVQEFVEKNLLIVEKVQERLSKTKIDKISRW